MRKAKTLCFLQKNFFNPFMDCAGYLLRSFQSMMEGGIST